MGKGPYLGVKRVYGVDDLLVPPECDLNGETEAFLLQAYKGPVRLVDDEVQRR